MSFISFFASNKKLTIHRKTQFTFSFLFMLKSQQKVDRKLSKICQAIKNLATDKRLLHASLKLLHSEDSRKCRRRFKLFVDLLDSLKQGTTGQLNIFDTCWLLQRVPGFTDFAGVMEITRLNTSEFLYRGVMNLYSHSVLSLQITLT